MARQELQLAKELISEKQFDKARMLLLQMKDDPTAQKWLAKLDEIVPSGDDSEPLTNGQASPWQYLALEVKRSYGIQYRVNSENKAEWKDQPIQYALNLLGREGWELIGFDSHGETANYIFKKPGVGQARKIDVWDQ